MKRRRVLAVAGTGLLAGCLDDVESAVLDEEVDASPSELQLDVDQLGEGWEFMGAEGEDDDDGDEGPETPDEADELGEESDAPDGETSIRTFFNHQSEELVMTTVAVFDAVEDCEDGYDETRENAEQYSTESIDIGEEGFGYSTGASMAVFRDVNVMAFVAIEPPQFGSIGIDDAVEIAETMYDEW